MLNLNTAEKGSPFSNRPTDTGVVWGRGYPVHADWAKQSNRVRDLLVHSFKAALFLFWGL